MDIFFSQDSLNSFWLPFLAALLAGIIVLLIQQLFNPPKQDTHRPPQSFKQVNQRIRQIVFVNQAPKQTSKAKTVTKEDAQNGFAAFGAVLIMAAVFYNLYESTIINVLMGLTTFTFVLWVFTLLHAYTRQIIHGKGWLTFLLCSLICVCGTLLSLHLLSNPLFVPDISEAHLEDLTKFVAAIYKVFGAGFALSGLVVMLITLLHYMLQINVVVYEQPWAITRWYLRVTYICTNPLLMGAILLGLLALAGLFSSGYMHYLTFTR